MFFFTVGFGFEVVVQGFFVEGNRDIAISFFISIDHTIGIEYANLFMCDFEGDRFTEEDLFHNVRIQLGFGDDVGDIFVDVVFCKIIQRMIQRLRIDKLSIRTFLLHQIPCKGVDQTRLTKRLFENAFFDIRLEMLSGFRFMLSQKIKDFFSGKIRHIDLVSNIKWTGGVLQNPCDVAHTGQDHAT